MGWEYVHVAIDDATRLAYVEVLPDEKASTAIAFLRRAVTHYASYGIAIERLLTDHGSAYRSTIHAIACRTLGIRHHRTRPYRPAPEYEATYWAMPQIVGGFGVRSEIGTGRTGSSSKTRRRRSGLARKTRAAGDRFGLRERAAAAT